MRTTVELSDPLYRRIRATAAARGERGFSAIVETAVRDYLDREEQGEESGAAFAAARGAWSLDDAAAVEDEVRSAWATWPTSRS